MTNQEQILKLRAARQLIDEVISSLKPLSDSEAFLEGADHYISECIRLTRESLSHEDLK